MKEAEYNFIIGVIPKEGLAGLCPPILLGYDGDKNLNTYFPMTWLILLSIPYQSESGFIFLL